LLTRSLADAKFFSWPDPPPPETVENKEEGEAEEVRDAADRGDRRAASPTTAGNDVSPPASPAADPSSHADSSNPDSSAPEAGEDRPPQDEPVAGDVVMTDAEADATIAAIINDVMQIGADATPPDPPTTANESTPPPAASSTSAPVSAAADDSVMEDSPADSPTPPTTDGPSGNDSTPAEPEEPVSHIYYFLQIFDHKNQTFRVVGSFFSRADENIIPALRKHLQWSEDKEFLVWSWVDSASIVAVSSGDTFWTPSCDGMCFIVGEKLTSEQYVSPPSTIPSPLTRKSLSLTVRSRRAELSAAGLFAKPEALVRYLWWAARNHPVRAFTGKQTLDASFTSTSYSGDFHRGCYHGKGMHVADSGSVYNGDFVLGQRYGKGRMEYPSGDIYEGDWVEDQCHGQGTFIEAKTGNKYVGGYKNGKRHGKGVSYWEVADEEMDLCQICYDEEQDALFYDCGHVCACVSCARQVETCPICRKNVISVVRIFRT
jgi:hypothetical protein